MAGADCVVKVFKDVCHDDLVWANLADLTGEKHLWDAGMSSIMTMYAPWLTRDLGFWSSV